MVFFAKSLAELWNRQGIEESPPDIKELCKTAIGSVHGFGLPAEMSCTSFGKRSHWTGVSSSDDQTPSELDDQATFGMTVVGKSSRSLARLRGDAKK